MGAGGGVGGGGVVVGAGGRLNGGMGTTQSSLPDVENNASAAGKVWVPYIVLWSKSKLDQMLFYLVKQTVILVKCFNILTTTQFMLILDAVIIL